MASGHLAPGELSATERANKTRVANEAQAAGSEIGSEGQSLDIPGKAEADASTPAGAPASAGSSHFTAGDIAHDFTGAKSSKAPGNTPEGKGQAAPTSPPPPTAQQSIDQILEPYMNEMMQLGPEYQAEMNFLQPYLAPTSNTGLAPAPAYTGPDASVVNKEQSALNTADTNLGNAIESEKAPGFGAVADATKQYENTLLYQQPIQAGLAYQKYLQTYEGEQPSTSSWPTEAQQAYQYVMGNSGSTNGLPSPAVSNPTNPVTPTGSGSTGTNQPNSPYS